MIAGFALTRAGSCSREVEGRTLTSHGFESPKEFSCMAVPAVWMVVRLLGSRCLEGIEVVCMRGTWEGRTTAEIAWLAWGCSASAGYTLNRRMTTIGGDMTGQLLSIAFSLMNSQPGQGYCQAD